MMKNKNIDAFFRIFDGYRTQSLSSYK